MRSARIASVVTSSGGNPNPIKTLPELLVIVVVFFAMSFSDYIKTPLFQLAALASGFLLEAVQHIDRICEFGDIHHCYKFLKLN
jgi:hypothetical protein